MKRLTILAAIHGDEVYGIELYDEFIGQYPELTAYIQLIIGNEEAYRLQKRYIDSDLNRHYADASDNHEAKELLRIEALLTDFNPDYIIDVHTTRRDSGIFFISDQPNDITKKIFNILPIDVCVMKDVVIKKSFIGNHTNAVSLEYSLKNITKETTREFSDGAAKLIQEIESENQGSRLYGVTKLITKDEWTSYKDLKNYDVKKEGTALMVPKDVSEMDAEYYGFWCQPLKTTNHLVIAVSPDSSLDLLGAHADVVVLDTDTIERNDTHYDTVYIRSHFSQPSTLPQNFRTEIDILVQQAKQKNPKVKFMDGMDNVDSIVAFEDKWHQYEIFNHFMPLTKLYSDSLDVSHFTRPVYKKRLSSRGVGVTWDTQNVVGSKQDWIVQESLDIQEELRVYSILGEIFPTGAIKQSMTEGQKAQGMSSRALTKDEITFSTDLMKQAPSIDIAGIDIARTLDGKLFLMEVNRSPGFAKFKELSGVNLADILYLSLPL